MHAILNRIEIDSLRHLPQELVDFARRQIVNAILYKGDERRREDRNPMLLPIKAVEVDADLEPVGEVMHMVTRDVSSKSIGLIHTEPIEAEQMVINMELAGTGVNILVEMKWTGELGMFYGAAGSYIRRLDHFPVDQ